MEYEYYTDMLANSTTFDPEHYSAETSEQIKAWMISVPRLAYQYARSLMSNMPSPRYTAYEDSDF